MKKHPVLTHPPLFPSGDVFVLIKWPNPNLNPSLVAPNLTR